MATPPLPDNPTIRIALNWTQTDDFTGGNRIFFNYSGGAPTSAQCAALATYIGGTLFGDTLASVINEDWALTEVDVLDISTEMGNSGKWDGSELGTAGGTPLPAQCASNIEFDIAERYRGGKPRIYLPPAVTGDLLNPSAYTSEAAAAIGAAWADFVADLITTGLTGASDLTHVLLSYYKGYNTATPPWRGPGFKYPPKYRAAAMSLNISGYAAKQRLGSQKRRRSSTTP